MMRGENEGQERDIDMWTGAEEVRNVMWIGLKIEWRGGIWRSIDFFGFGCCDGLKIYE